MIKPIIKNLYFLLLEILALPIVVLMALIARFREKPIDVGIGPEPLVSHIYHKQAFDRFGYTVETFVNQIYFITDEFDIRGDKSFFSRYRLLRWWTTIYLFVLVVFRYKCIYIYFNGGPLMGCRVFLWKIEPLLYKIAQVKVVTMPYGGDIQDLTRTKSLSFKHAMARDYPQFKSRRARIARRIDLWTCHADHIISGCDWVEYMYHWDTLMLGHFSIDLDQWKSPTEPSPSTVSPSETKLRILHAPNHRTIKGTKFFIQAVEELAKEGVNVEIVLLERVPNTKVREVMATVDVVADQLVIGWYAMFALEAMAMEKPVLCYLRDDLMNLYTDAGLIEPNEIPIINCSTRTVKEAIRRLAMQDRAELRTIGQRSRAFAARHHSLETVGKVFDTINRSLDIQPTNLVAAQKKDSTDEQHQTELS